MRAGLVLERQIPGQHTAGLTGENVIPHSLNMPRFALRLPPELSLDWGDTKAYKLHTTLNSIAMDKIND